MINKLLKWKGVKLVFVAGKNNRRVSDFISNLVGDFCRVKRIKNPKSFLGKIPLLFGDVVLLNDEEVDLDKLDKFFSSFLEIVVLVNSEDLNREKQITSKLSKENTILVDYENRDRVPGKRMKRFLSFGTDSEADFFVSDINKNDKTNFKINYDGSSVPVWIAKNSSEEDVLSVASGLGVGVLLGINFVSLTQKLKE